MKMECQSNPGSNPEDLYRRLVPVRIVSSLLVFMGLFSMALGIPTIVLVVTSVTKPSNPFTACFGISAGGIAALTGMFGLLLANSMTSENCKDQPKCYSGACRGLSSGTTALGVVDFSFSIWALVICSEGVLSEKCGGNTWSANYLLAGINMTLGLIIVITGIANSVILWRIRSCKKPSN